MGNIVDINALYNVGKAMGGPIRDNRQRDAFARFIGGTALQFLGQAFETRKALRQQGNTTISNSKLKVGEGDYNESMLDIATGVIDMGKKDLNKGANLSATGRGGKGTDLINKTNNDLKNLTSGLDFVKGKMKMWEDIYKNGNYTDAKGNVTKVSINSAAPAASQALAASFADGSIANHMDFRDGKWGLVGEQETDGVKTETFTNLNDLELPELDESRAVNDYSKELNGNIEQQGYKNKTGNWSQYENDVRDNIFNDFQDMTENQISSKWFSKNGNDFSTPALNYLTQEGGYTIAGVKHEALLDPNAMDITALEQIRRQDIATGELERLKLEDFDSYEKTTWLINNDIMPSAKEAFERGFNQRPDKKLSSGSQRDTLPVNYGGGYITRTQANNVLSSIKNKKRTVTYDRQEISYDEKLNTYIYDETKEPISNYDILRGHEIWDQGYQIEDFAGTQKQSDNKQINKNSTDYNPNKNKNKKGPGVPVVTSGGRF